MPIEANIILDWLKNTDINLSVIARNTGISRKSLYNWTKGGTPTLKKLELLTEYYNKVVERESVKVDSEGKIDYQYVAEVLKEKITAQEALHQKEKMERDIWDLLEYDSVFEVHLKIKRFKIYRKIHKATGFQYLSDNLGYTVDELKNDLFCLGVWYEMRKHPIDKIITKETKSSLRHYTDNFPVLFNAMKSVVGDHYIPLNIVYKGKNNLLVQASVYNKVHWKDMKVESKVKMFSESIAD